VEMGLQQSEASLQSLRDPGEEIRCSISLQASDQTPASSRVSAVEASTGPGPIALGVRAEVFRPEAVAPAHVALAAGSAVPVPAPYRSVQAVGDSVEAHSGAGQRSAAACSAAVCWQ
jgi:hypothetical protein